MIKGVKPQNRSLKGAGGSDARGLEATGPHSGAERGPRWDQRVEKRGSRTSTPCPGKSRGRRYWVPPRPDRFPALSPGSGRRFPSPRPAHPPSGSVPAARVKAADGSAICSADRAGGGRRPLRSRSSRPGPAAPGRLQPRAARSLTQSLAPRQVVLPAERPRPCRPHRRCSAEAESGPPLP